MKNCENTEIKNISKEPRQIETSKTLSTNFGKKRKEEVGTTTDLWTWGYGIEVQESKAMGNSRKIRLSRNKKNSSNSQGSAKKKKKKAQLRLPKHFDYQKSSFPIKDKNYKSFLDKTSRSGRILPRSSTWNEESSENDCSDFDIESDFFSKVEMISRQSAPQKNSHGLHQNIQKNTFSSLTGKAQKQMNMIDPQKINIMVSFGEEMVSENHLFQTESKKKKVSAFKRPSKKPKSIKKNFKKRRRASYYSKASQRWNWDESVSQQRSIESNINTPKNNKLRKNKPSFKTSQDKSETDLKHEQRRLRKALKSIKF